MVVAPSYPSAGSISGIFVADQVAALRRAYLVTVVAPEPRGWRRALRRNSLPEPAEGRSSEDRVLRPIARTWIPRSARSVRRGFVVAVEKAFAETTQLRGVPDLIHAHVTYPAGYAAVTVGQRHSVPVVLTEHSGPFGAILTSSLARRAAEWTLDHADRVLAVGPALRAEMVDFAPGRRVDIVENVVDTDFFSPAGLMPIAGGRALRLFTLGLQTPQKGVDVLLDATARLAAAGMEFELAIGGDDPVRSDLEARARRLGVDGSCRFVGVQTREDVREWLRWCDIYVSASRHESFGLALAEALACARAVVATRSGGPETFIDPAFGILVDRDDPAALASAIASVASGDAVLDPGLGRQRIVDRFGWPAFLSRIGRVYEEVLLVNRSAAR